MYGKILYMTYCTMYIYEYNVTVHKGVREGRDVRDIRNVKEIR